MASASNYASKKILDHLFNDGTFAVPTTPHLALCTVVPTDASTGSTITEATYTGYVRLAVPPSSMSAASGTTTGTKTNSADLTFAYTSGSSTVVAWALCDAATTGNVLLWGTVTPVTVDATHQPPIFTAGTFIVNCD